MAEENEQEKAYEVKDKRRINPDGTLRDDAEPEALKAEAAPEQEAPEEAAAPAEETAPPAEEAAGEEEAAEFPQPSIYELMQFMVGMLAEQTWAHLGLRIAPGQKEPQKDLTQAKVAIDTIVFMIDKLHPHIGEEERKALRALVGDLQINFVRQSQ